MGSISASLFSFNYDNPDKKKGQLISCPSNVNPQTHKQYRTYCTTNIIFYFIQKNILRTNYHNGTDFLLHGTTAIFFP
jgi:hypothetical protein